MVKEYNVFNALQVHPEIRMYLPKELIREITKDEKYIIKIDEDEKTKKINSLEIGYPEDEEWKL